MVHANINLTLKLEGKRRKWNYGMESNSLGVPRDKKLVIIGQSMNQSCNWQVRAKWITDKVPKMPMPPLL